MKKKELEQKVKDLSMLLDMQINNNKVLNIRNKNLQDECIKHQQTIKGLEEELNKCHSKLETE